MCALPIYLVDPERVLHILPDIEAFEAYCDARNLKKSNMKELLGIFARGRVGTAAKFKYGHVLLSSVEWVAHSQSNDSIPLIGSPQDMFKTLQKDHAMTCACEHPARSNMDVFIVTHSPWLENGERRYVTDVWRIFSEAKGSSLFHNQALDDIVKYYKDRLKAGPLTRVYVFSDGCRSQYKGNRNFVRIAQFPSRIGGVQLVHRFAASHHFKGPHDAYGKDAKLLCRTAERNGKARLASTHDVYYFCATKLPRPRRDCTTADAVVAALPPVQTPLLTPEQQAKEAEEAEAALARAPTTEASRRMHKRLAAAGILPSPMDIETETAPGSEASADGEERVEEEAPRRPGIFTASNYFWLYYPAAGVRVTRKVGINQGSGPYGAAAPGEYHAILDVAADVEADTIAGSNSTYEFAGMRADKPELLYTRTNSCACPSCRDPRSVNVEHSSCACMDAVGRWRQETIYPDKSVPAQRKVQLDSIKDFRAKIQPGRLYAAFAAYREVLGGRPYWLLKTKSEAKTGETIRVPGGRTIAKNQWFVEAQWYLSTSDNQGSKRYKLLPEIVHVPPDTFIQEHELEWSHEGRGDGESILSDASHVALMWHNYSNVA